jgi:hypothetical protein
MTGNVICIGAIEAVAGRSGASNAMAMFVALVSVTLIVFIWAAFFRKPPRRRHHHSHHRQNHRNSSESSAPKADSQPSDSSDRKPRFRRRRRHKERRLNPTLSKTGGLPGIRSDDSEPPHT